MPRHCEEPSDEAISLSCHYMEIASPPVRGTRNDILSDVLMSERLRHFGQTTLTKRILLTRKDILC